MHSSPTKVAPMMVGYGAIGIINRQQKLLANCISARAPSAAASNDDTALNMAEG